MGKILILTNHSYMLYRFRLELIQALRQEHEVVLVMPFVGHEEDFQAMGLRCIETKLDRRSINPFKDFSLLRRYRKILKQEQPDLVLTYSIKPNLYGGLACAMRKIPYCTHIQGLGTAFQRRGLAFLVGRLYKLALKRSRVAFFENRFNADIFLQKKLLPAHKLCVLPGAGVNVTEYPYYPHKKQSPIRFLFVGRFMREKGVDELFAAMERLQETHPHEAVLDLVGFFEDAYREKVDALTRKGLAVFHGFQTDPRPFYKQADCVILPSYHEGMSNVLLEAAAMGCPLITSDIPGCREAVNDGESGYLCHVQDADSLYEAMRRILELSPEALAQMGRKGAEKIRQEFDRAQVVQATVQALFPDSAP